MCSKKTWAKRMAVSEGDDSAGLASGLLSVCGYNFRNHTLGREALAGSNRLFCRGPADHSMAKRICGGRGFYERGIVPGHRGADGAARIRWIPFRGRRLHCLRYDFVADRRTAAE